MSKIIDNRYTVVKELKKGGYGQIFVVYHSLLKQNRVAKLLHRTEDINKERFVREGEILAKLEHRHIVKVLDFFVDSSNKEDNYYLIMPYFPHGSLEDRLKKEGFLQIEEVIAIGQQLSDALVYIHQNGIIHRDIKPANVLVFDDVNLHVKLSDFGIAQLLDDTSITQEGRAPYTRRYAAPEQHWGECTFQSDIYSLGATLYYLVTGKKEPLSIYEEHGDFIPPSNYRDDVPSWLEGIIWKSLSKEPKERYESAKKLLDALTDGDRDIDKTDETDGTEEQEAEPLEGEQPKPPALSKEVLLPSPNNEILWEYDAQAPILSRPIADRDNLYVSTREGKVIALSQHNGTGRGSDWPCELQLNKDAITGGLALCHNRLLVPGGDGTLYQIDVATGIVEKRYFIGGRLNAQPLVVEKRAYVVSDMSTKRYNSGEGHLAIVDVPRQALIASHSVSPSGLAARPALLGNTLYLGAKSTSKDTVYSIPKSGGKAKIICQTDRNVVSPIIADPQRRQLYIADLSGRIMSLSPKNNTVKTLFDTKSGIQAEMQMTDDRLYVGATNGRIYALNLTTGWFLRRKHYTWEYDTKAKIRGLAVLNQKYIFVLKQKGQVIALNEKGKLVWDWPDNGEVWITMLVTNRGRLYLCSNSGRITALAPNIRR